MNKPKEKALLNLASALEKSGLTAYQYRLVSDLIDLTQELATDAVTENHLNLVQAMNSIHSCH